MQLLINKAAVKKFALEKAKSHYTVKAYQPTRISTKFLNDVDAEVRAFIDKYLEHRPSRGKTL